MYKGFGKRILDVIISLVTLIIFIVPMSCLAAIIGITLGTPVFFRQKRTGCKGQPFMLLKFRTMTNEKDNNGNLLPDKIRLHPFGKLLRRTSLDELPELFNVLKGYMSLVGPRPLLVKYLPHYTPEQMRRHDVKPGITGWAQINGRNDLTWEEKFALDVWYVDNLQFMLDLKIIFISIWIIFKAEGISQPGSATAEEFLGNE